MAIESLNNWEINNNQKKWFSKYKDKVKSLVVSTMLVSWANVHAQNNNIDLLNEITQSSLRSLSKEVDESGKIKRYNITRDDKLLEFSDLNKDGNLDSTWIFSEQQLSSFLDIELKWPNKTKILKNLLIFWWETDLPSEITMQTLLDIWENNPDFYDTLIKNLTERSFLAPLDVILIDWDSWIKEYMDDDIRIQEKWLEVIWITKTEIDKIVDKQVWKLLWDLPEEVRKQLENNPKAYRKFKDRISSISLWIATWDNRGVWLWTTIKLDDIVWWVIDSMSVWVWVVDWTPWLVLSVNKSANLTDKVKLSWSLWAANFVFPFAYLWLTYSTDKYYNITWWVTVFEWWYAVTAWVKKDIKRETEISNLKKSAVNIDKDWKIHVYFNWVDVTDEDLELLRWIEENLNKYTDKIYDKLPDNSVERKIVAETVFDAMKKLAISENITRNEWTHFSWLLWWVAFVAWYFPVPILWISFTTIEKKYNLNSKQVNHWFRWVFWDVDLTKTLEVEKEQISVIEFPWTNFKISYKTNNWELSFDKKELSQIEVFWENVEYFEKEWEKWRVYISWLKELRFATVHRPEWVVPILFLNTPVTQLNNWELYIPKDGIYNEWDIKETNQEYIKASWWVEVNLNNWYKEYIRELSEWIKPLWNKIFKYWLSEYEFRNNNVLRKKYTELFKLNREWKIDETYALMLDMFEKNISRDNGDKTFLQALKKVTNKDQKALLITQFTDKYQVDRNNRFLEDNFKWEVNRNFNKASLKTFIWWNSFSKPKEEIIKENNQELLEFLNKDWNSIFNALLIKDWYSLWQFVKDNISNPEYVRKELQRLDIFNIPWLTKEQESYVKDIQTRFEWIVDRLIINNRETLKIDEAYDREQSLIELFKKIWLKDSSYIMDMFREWIDHIVWYRDWLWKEKYWREEVQNAMLFAMTHKEYHKSTNWIVKSMWLTSIAEWTLVERNKTEVPEYTSRYILNLLPQAAKDMLRTKLWLEWKSDKELIDYLLKSEEVDYKIVTAIAYRSWTLSMWVKDIVVRWESISILPSGWFYAQNQAYAGSTDLNIGVTYSEKEPEDSWIPVEPEKPEEPDDPEPPSPPPPWGWGWWTWWTWGWAWWWTWGWWTWWTWGWWWR